MFDRFNDPSRKLVQVARAEAVRLGAAAIDPEHVLLAMLQHPGSVVAFVLDKLGVDTSTLRADVESALGGAGAPPPDPGAELPFTPATKQMLLATLAEAEFLGHRYIGNEHVLLGLIRTGGQRLSEALAARGLVLEAVRSEIRKGLGEDGDARGRKA
jgi:ATP-dependent Clp protease ATP-binding subunit ClpC